jgi:hypothetical protein
VAAIDGGPVIVAAGASQKPAATAGSRHLSKAPTRHRDDQRERLDGNSLGLTR